MKVSSLSSGMVHTSRKATIGLAGIVLVASAQQQAQPDVLSYVDPLIGTVNGGHVFAGATLPFSMAKASADVINDNQAGFAYDGGAVYGFSHMHDDGTGGSPSLGNFPLFPYAACRDNLVDNCDFPQATRAVNFTNSSVVATPGYFAISLINGIHTEMTVTNHTALYQFSFPSNPVEKNSTLMPMIIADLTDLPISRSNASASIDPKTGRMTGTGTFNPSFGIGTYDLHFCADYKGASIDDTGVYHNNRAGSQPKNITVYPDNVDISPEIVPAGVYARFNKPSNSNNTIQARVGVSFISIAKACQNAENEIPDYDFQKVKSTAEQAWRDKLNVIKLDSTGVNSTILKTFWSGVYRGFMSPQDYTGENPLWQSSEPYYDSYYCIWDSFRAFHPFLTIVDQESQSRMVRSLIDIYEHEGWLPDCRMSLSKGFTQGGSNADVVLTDSYLKSIPGVDWSKAYSAVVKDAEIEPPVWGVEGRGGLQSWKTLNYIPTEDFDPYGSGPFTRSISRTVEYAYDDFCIAEMAKGLGHQADYEKYIQRSHNWKNMFLASQNSSINGTNTGFTGFLQPRFLNGTFGFQDPIFCSPLLNFSSCYLNPDGHETYEGSAWLYSFFVPGDMAALVTTLGGPSTFVKRLNFLHESGLLYIGDEQAFLPVFQYHYGGRPALSSVRAHYYIPSQFNDTLIGIPGNDDSGAMGTFSSLSMMGLFPNPGQDVYLITPPFFQQVSVTNKQTGKTATIKNINFDPSYQAIYIQSAKLNGQPYTKSWIGHEFFLEGMTLELTLGRNESLWGTHPQDLPPSLSTTTSSH